MAPVCSSARLGIWLCLLLFCPQWYLLIYKFAAYHLRPIQNLDCGDPAAISVHILHSQITEGSTLKEEQVVQVYLYQRTSRGTQTDGPQHQERFSVSQPRVAAKECH